MARFNLKSLLISLFICFFILSCVTTTQPSTDWNATVKNVSSGVVSIYTDVPVSFDGKWNSSSHATGFIVDATRGIILTNRHVVTPGPVTAKAVLINNEEIALTPLYIDPIHDFGFYQYDPSEIKHITPHEFKLNAESAYVGQDIRIIGNDAGQKISILDGTISRLDRDAPNYGKWTYNDFNTYYIQAATASTGGSSGSPVINKKGEVVALNAGSQSRSANAFYLPLTMIKQALNALQNNQKIQRGGLQTTFVTSPYAELKRLGLTEALETSYRALNSELKGLLVINKIIPHSPAAKRLAIGDILLSINGKPIVDFIALENILNSNINNAVKITILRSATEHQVEVKVSDLTQITPEAFLTFDESIFHNLSYQQARHFNKPIDGVFVAMADASFKQAGIPNHSVIKEFNGVAISTIHDLHQQLTSIASGEKVHVRYFDQHDPNILNYALVEINRKWFEHSFCEKDAVLGYWPCQFFQQESSVKKSIKPQVNTEFLNNKKPVHPIENSFVKVHFTMPYSINGTSNGSRTGTGLIVDTNKGWIVTDRSTVYSALGDIKVTFGNTLEIEGKVEYIHPLHNLALISYQPKAIGDLKVKSAKISKTPLKVGDEVIQAGINYEGVTVLRKTLVDNVQELWVRTFSVPQFIEDNIEVVYLRNANYSIDGILLNKQNEVAALWATIEHSNEKYNGTTSYSAGIQAEYIQEIINLAEHKHTLYSLDISSYYISPVIALQRGLPHDWLNKVLATTPNKPKLLTVNYAASSAPSAKVLTSGDIILAINDQAVSSFREVELLSQAPEVKVSFYREGNVHHEMIKTVSLPAQDITQVFYWSGLYIHAIHRPAQLQRSVSPDGVYLASYKYGSPATRYELFAMKKIIEIDDTKITNNNDFFNAVKNKKHQDTVAIKTIDFDGNISVISLVVDNHYWPFYEVRYENGEWHKINHRVQ